MKLLLDFPTIGEPHYAQAIPASLIKDKQVKYLQARRRTRIRGSRESEAEGGITRTGKTVDVKMIAIRSHFAPDNIEGVQVGDTVVLPRHEHRAGLGHPARLRGARHEHVGADPPAG